MLNKIKPLLYTVKKISFSRKMNMLNKIKPLLYTVKKIFFSQKMNLNTIEYNITSVVHSERDFIFAKNES